MDIPSDIFMLLARNCRAFLDVAMLRLVSRAAREGVDVFARGALCDEYLEQRWSGSDGPPAAIKTACLGLKICGEVPKAAGRRRLISEAELAADHRVKTYFGPLAEIFAHGDYPWLPREWIGDLFIEDAQARYRRHFPAGEVIPMVVSHAACLTEHARTREEKQLAASAWEALLSVYSLDEIMRHAPDPHLAGAVSGTDSTELNQIISSWKILWDCPRIPRNNFLETAGRYVLGNAARLNQHFCANDARGHGDDSQPDAESLITLAEATWLGFSAEVELSMVADLADQRGLSPDMLRLVCRVYGRCPPRLSEYGSDHPLRLAAEDPTGYIIMSGLLALCPAPVAHRVLVEAYSGRLPD